MSNHQYNNSQMNQSSYGGFGGFLGFLATYVLYNITNLMHSIQWQSMGGFATFLSGITVTFITLYNFFKKNKTK